VLIPERLAAAFRRGAKGGGVLADCVFCRIAAGTIPCARLFENEDVLAFLDIAPVRPGHALVIPKAHFPTLFELPAGLGGALLAAAGRVGAAVMQAVGAEGLNLQMNNLAAAGQLVMHAHLHLIPRQSGDGLALWPQHPYPGTDEMNALAERIRNALR